MVRDPTLRNSSHATTPDMRSNMEFIKEFEELKLKQKILIDSLKKGQQDKKQEALDEMNSKLDFIVTLFQQATGEGEEEEGEESEEEASIKTVFQHVGEMQQKLEALEENLDKKLGIVEGKVNGIEKEVKELTKTAPKPQFEENPPIPDSNRPAAGAGAPSKPGGNAPPGTAPPSQEKNSQQQKSEQSQTTTPQASGGAASTEVNTTPGKIEGEDKSSGSNSATQSKESGNSQDSDKKEKKRKWF